MYAEAWYLVDIFIAAVLGFLIGLERKLRSKEAGIRTHTIVCLASALFMIISKYAFSGAADHDPSRIAAQIIPGIGFLGAGIIVYRKNIIHGLTTAAGVWATSGVGMACGGRLYIVAVGTTLILILFQILLHTKKGIFSQKRSYRLNITFSDDGDKAAIVKEVFKVRHFHRFHVNRNGDNIICEVALFTDNEYTSEQLNAYMRNYPFIVSIQRVDEE
ncbi:MAG: MgtC/SapB family protein [Clostridia bacterium]|nr:MgtC/SapB family protein [Clostridia bacterium]